MPRFHGHLKASLQPLSGVIKVTLPIETPIIHVPLSGRVGGTLSHKSYSSLSWEDQTANGQLHGQSPRSGFAVIGPFEPMPAGAGTAPPRCHPPPDGGTLRHVSNSLPGPLSEGSVHGNGSRQPDNWLSALAEPFVTVLAHGNGVYKERVFFILQVQWGKVTKRIDDRLAVLDNYFSVRCEDDNFITVFGCKMKEKQRQNHELITS